MESADSPSSIEPITSLVRFTPHACDNVGSTMNTRSLMYITRKTVVITDMSSYSHGASQRKSAECCMLRAFFILKSVFFATSAKIIPSNSGKIIWYETLFSINIFQINTVYIIQYLIMSLIQFLKVFFSFIIFTCQQINSVHDNDWTIFKRNKSLSDDTTKSMFA